MHDHQRRTAADQYRLSIRDLDELGDVEEEQAAIFRRAAEPTSATFVAEVDGRFAGVLVLQGFPPRALAHVTTLGMAVEPDLRGQGVGRALLSAALAWAYKAGLRRVELYTHATNLAAQALYRSAGFAVEGRRRGMVRVGNAYEDDLVMGLLLSE